MTQLSTITVAPSVSRMLGMLILGTLGMVGGLVLIFGPKPVLALVAAVVLGVGAVLFIMAVIRQRPRVVISPDGFVFHKLFGARFHKWEDIDGPFAVIKIGWNKAVAYNLTADYKARVGKKPTSLFSGYDDAISGAFKLSAEELAALLNQLKQRSLGVENEVTGDVAQAQAPSAPLPEAQAEGNGSPILRIAAGVIALLFAGALLLMAAEEKLPLDTLVFLAVLVFLFGWYAIRGRKGLPGFLTKKWGA